MRMNTLDENTTTTSATAAGAIRLPGVRHRPTDDEACWTVTNGVGSVSLPTHWQPADWRVMRAHLPVNVVVLPIDTAWHRTADGREHFGLQVRP